MPYPIINALPQAPLRVTDPNNFVSESAVFLNAFGNFVNQTNSLVNYVNGLNPNSNNFGTLAQINPVFPPFISPPRPPFPAPNTLQYTSALDTQFAYVRLTQDIFNACGDFIDQTVAQTGTVPTSFGTYPSATIGLFFPQRSFSRDDFNFHAGQFISENLQINDSMFVRINTISFNCFNVTDCGLITDNNIDEVIDAGGITDNNIELHFFRQ